MRILIVDDSKAMRMIVKRTLGQAGYKDAEIEEAANGVEALEAITAKPPDLVLSDWNMPEMTGIELLRVLRKEGPFVKFGFVTSESTPEMRDQAIRAGARFLIAKPFTAEVFEDTLAGVLSGAMAAIPLPIQESVRDLLADLLGRGVAVDKAGELDLGSQPGVVGLYVTGDDTVTAVALGDVGFVCRTGAALAMIPAAVADESVTAGEIPENLLENTHEVINIASRLVNSASTPHVRLTDVHVMPASLPDDVSALMASPSARRDFAVTIDGYGDARFSLLTA
jgi:two-component system chemotaxis response regulator CheY